MNYFQLAIAAIIFTVGTIVGWNVSGWISDWETSAKLMKQASAMTLQCDNATKRTKDANDELQKNYARIRNRLAADRLRGSKCTIPLGSEALAILARAGYAGHDGISTDWLREYAAQCEIYRSERIVLEKFIDDQSADSNK